MIRILALLLSLTLAACASDGAAVQRYQLSQLNAPPPTASATTEQRLLRLLPVSLSKLVDTQGLVFQSSDILVVEATGHQWAEDLGDQLTRSLRLQLAAEKPGLLILDAADSRAGDRADYLLQVQVDSFQGRHDGLAVVSGHWLLRDGQGRLLQTGDLSHQQALIEDGYPALVRSLSEAWKAVTLTISREVGLSVGPADFHPAAD